MRRAIFGRNLKVTLLRAAVWAAVCVVVFKILLVHVRVDERTKQRAAKTLAAMGIPVSDAVRMLLVRVAAEKALPSV